MKSDKKARIAVLADYIFYHPDKKTREILIVFAKKWQLSESSIHRIIRQAKDYNTERIDRHEEKKNKIIDNEIEEYAGKIIQRLEALSILSTIAKGETREVTIGEGSEILIPSDGDRIRAIKDLAVMEGWNATTKQEVEISGGINIEDWIKSKMK